MLNGLVICTLSVGNGLMIWFSNLGRARQQVTQRRTVVNASSFPLIVQNCCRVFANSAWGPQCLNCRCLFSNMSRVTSWAAGSSINCFFYRTLDLNFVVVLPLAAHWYCPETGLTTGKDMTLPHNRSSIIELKWAGMLFPVSVILFVVPPLSWFILSFWSTIVSKT